MRKRAVPAVAGQLADFALAMVAGQLELQAAEPGPAPEPAGARMQLQEARLAPEASRASVEAVAWPAAAGPVELLQASPERVVLQVPE